MTYRRKIDINPFNSIISILFVVFALMALYWVASGIFWILTKVSPILLIGALIIDHTIVLNYGKWLINLVKKNPLMGILAIILSVVAYPITFGFLFGKALLYRKVNKIKQEIDIKQNGEFADYEEVREEPEIRLELPDYEKPKPKPKAKPKKDNSNYDQFFD